MITSENDLVEFVRSVYDLAETVRAETRGLKSRTGKEYVDVMEVLEPLNITDGFIEIGSAWGGSFHMWSTIISGPKISVDLMIHDEERAFYRRNNIWNVHFTEVHSILCNSHIQSAVDQVAEILKGNQVGFLYIDADHTYGSVKKDYEMYKHFVRPGGFIGMHDITGPGEPGSATLWNELKSDCKLKYSEFLTDTGIGLICVV